jgi:hypothetical protein
MTSEDYKKCNEATKEENMKVVKKSYVGDYFVFLWLFGFVTDFLEGVILKM